MTWPFDKENPPNPDASKNEGAEKKGEKSPAEIIAESLSAGLKPVTDTLSALSTRLDAIESNTKKPERKADPVEAISVLDDENAAFAQRMTPMLLRQLELESRVVKNDIKAEYAAAGYGDLWAQFETEINSVLESSPLVNGEGKTMRGDPQYVRNVVDMIMGRAARKAGMRFDGKSKGFFLETAGNNGGEGRNETVSDGLSDGQRKVFGRMKVSTDDAKKVMAKLKFVS
jgi:hypothetical protein